MCTLFVLSVLLKLKQISYLNCFKRLLNSTVLNSFVVYRQVTGRNLQQLSCRIQLVEGLCHEICACCREVGCTRAESIRQHISTADWKIFSDKSGTQNWKIKTSEEVCCVLKARKKEIFSVLLGNMWCGPLLGRLLWAVSH